MTFPRKLTAIAAAAALIASGAAAASDAPAPGDPTTPRAGVSGERPGRHDPERRQMRLRRHAEKLEKQRQALNLDERTAARLEEVLLAARERARAAKEAVKAERDTLRTLVEAGAGPGELEAQLRKLQEAQAAVPPRGSVLDETRHILTTEQQARLALTLSDRHQGKHGKHGKGKSGHHRHD